MKVYNQDKTSILTSYDLEKGYLQSDKIKIGVQPYQPEKQAVYEYTDWVEFPNGGKSRKEKLVSEYMPEQPEKEIYEDIQVYIPYTEQQYKNILRNKRVNLLSAFDKWEKAVLRGRETDDKNIMQWYQSLLKLEETAFDSIPERVKYYLQGATQC